MGSIGDACHQHLRVAGGLIARFLLTLLLGSLLSTRPGGFGVGGRVRGWGSPAMPGMEGLVGTLPRSHHLFTRWKYFCRKPGSTALLQSSSRV